MVQCERFEVETGVSSRRREFVGLAFEQRCDGGEGVDIGRRLVQSVADDAGEAKGVTAGVTTGFLDGELDEGAHERGVRM